MLYQFDGFPGYVQIEDDLTHHMTSPAAIIAHTDAVLADVPGEIN